MKRSVLLTVIVSFHCLNETHANSKFARVPLKFQPVNINRSVGNDRNIELKETILVANISNPNTEKDRNRFTIKNNKNEDRSKENDPNDVKFDDRRKKKGMVLGTLKSYENDPKVSRMHHLRGIPAVLNKGLKSSEHFHWWIKPKMDIDRRKSTLNSGTNDFDGEEAFQDKFRIPKKRKHETMFKRSKRAEEWHQRFTQHKIEPKSNREGHPNATDVAEGILIFDDGVHTNKFRLWDAASALMRCQHGTPPLINLPVNSQLNLDTKDANLDQNTECSWHLKVLGGRGLMVHCYLMGSKEEYLTTSSSLSLAQADDKNGLVETGRLDRSRPRGIWFFRSKQIKITYFAGSTVADSNSHFKCDVLVR